MNHDMFSMTPSGRRFVRSAIFPARSATLRAASWGVVTTSIEAPGMNEASEIETSPVPGGRSQSRKSRSPHQTSPRNCWIALCSIGPRQITGVSSGTKWPIEITFTPCASRGRIMSLNPTGLPSAPSIRGTLNPHTSASSTPTERPDFARAAARFTVTLDLPTPPLPEAIAMIDVCGENEIFVSGAAGCPPRSCDTSFSRSSPLIGVSSTSTRSTPSSGCTAAVTSEVIRSFRGHPSIVMSTWTRTTPASTSTDLSIPISSIGRPISGSLTLFRASRTCASVATDSPPELLAALPLTLGV